MGRGDTVNILRYVIISHNLLLSTLPMPISGAMTRELNYHQLRYFGVVAREGSIARAARVLGVSQATISAQLKALQSNLGERLIERVGRGVQVTEVGKVAAHYADEIFALGNELVDTVRGRPAKGPLRFTVGISDSLPKLTTFRLLQPVLALGPFRLVLRIDKTDRLLADLATLSLDLVLADQPIPPSVKTRAYNHLLGECGVTVFAVPRLAARYRRRFPRSLDGAPFLLQTENTAVRRSLDQWFASAGVRPTIVAEAEDVAMLQVLGQEGMGLFAAPSVAEAAVRRSYRVGVVGRLVDVRERFYAITVERRLKHPAAVAISQRARQTLQ